MKKLIWVLFLLALPLAQAETIRYVGDNLEITMRTGKGVKHRILRMLPVGTKLHVLKSDPDGYSLVRTEDGVEGWVLTRFLSSQPSAKQRLKEAEEMLAKLRIENHQLKKQLETLVSQKTAMEQRIQALSEDNKRLQQELAAIRHTAANALAIEHENKTLREKLVGLERSLQALEQENARLKDRSARDWFLVGAGVLLLGIIIGVILPKLRVQKKHDWDSL